jgi:hypothetical protein
MDPVIRDLNNHLAERDATETIYQYMADHDGEHPCQHCDHDCRRCGLRKYRHIGRREANQQVHPTMRPYLNWIGGKK